jgi:hypothetical protein
VGIRRFLHELQKDSSGELSKIYPGLPKLGTMIYVSSMIYQFAKQHPTRHLASRHRAHDFFDTLQQTP